MKYFGIGRKIALLIFIGIGAYFTVLFLQLDDWFYHQWFERYTEESIKRESIWLPAYRLEIQALEVDGVRENLSGITYNPVTESLWLIINRPAQLVELSSALNKLRTITLKNFKDTEAVAYIEGDQYAIADERNESISIAAVSEDTSVLDYGKLHRIVLNQGGNDNRGFEGITIDHTDRSILVARENNPMEVLKVSGLLDESHYIEIAAALEIEKTNSLLEDISGMHLDPTTGHLLILSQEAQLLAEFNPEGERVSYMNLNAGFNGLQNGIRDAEGVTLDSDGNLYIVSEPNLIYKFKKMQ
jgi:uncharacterized protein YjiK